MSDRTIHAVIDGVYELVRYDRAGKWYVEGATKRRALTLAEAVALAASPDSVIIWDQPGGQVFCSRLRKLVSS